MTLFEIHNKRGCSPVNNDDDKANWRTVIKNEDDQGNSIWDS